MTHSNRALFNSDPTAVQLRPTNRIRTWVAGAFALTAFAAIATFGPVGDAADPALGTVMAADEDPDIGLVW